MGVEPLKQKIPIGNYSDRAFLFWTTKISETSIYLSLAKF